MKVVTLTFLLLCPFGAALAQPGKTLTVARGDIPKHHKQPLRLLAPLNMQSRAESCGCNLKSGDHFYVRSEDDHKLWMNMRGIDVELDCARSGSDAMQKGATHRDVCTYDDTKVVVDWVVATACPQSKDDNCEVTGYTATLRAVRGAHKQTVALMGECGC